MMVPCVRRTRSLERAAAAVAPVVRSKAPRIMCGMVPTRVCRGASLESAPQYSSGVRAGTGATGGTVFTTRNSEGSLYRSRSFWFYVMKQQPDNIRPIIVQDLGVNVIYKIFFTLLGFEFEAYCVRGGLTAPSRGEVGPLLDGCSTNDSCSTELPSSEGACFAYGCTRKREQFCKGYL